VIEAAVAQCRITLSASADTSPEAQKVLLERFAEFGVTKAQIEKRIQRRLDAIQPAQVVMLRGVYRSLKDGMSNAADWFEADTQTSTGGITPPPQLQEAQSAPVEAQAAPVAAEPVAEPVAAPVAQEKPARVIGRQARPAATAAPAAAPATAVAPAAPAEDPEPVPSHELTAADTGETVQQDDFLS
jgi:hypothetical protein